MQVTPILKNQSKKKKLPKRDLSTEPTVVGTIHVHPKGFAFVTPEDSTTHSQDIFIPKHLKAGAVDGDRVEVVIRPSRRPEKGPEGSVKTIVHRGRSEVAGVVWLINPKGDYVLYLPSLGPQQAAIVKKTKCDTYQVGDRLLLKVKSWGKDSGAILCHAIKKIGSINDPATDIQMAVEDFKIRSDFPKKVLQHASAFPATVPNSDLEKRRDLTALETITIDPDTARDFDDALSLTQDDAGNYHLAIHIADVTHYVREGSQLDKEAQQRCNSVYFPGKCIPMLPESLSNHLCSLVEKQVRLTVSVLAELDRNGELKTYEIVKGYIRSQKRFTYGEAKEVLDKKKKSPHFAMLQRMQTLCLLLKAKRTKRGSVDLALPETVVLVDDQGTPYDYAIIDYDITHQMVEECMLTANALVAKHIAQQGLPGLFRVHEAPDQESIEDFYAFARTLGFQIPAEPTIADVQRLFDEAKGTTHAEQLAIGFIRSMKLAIYSHENIGHYGLALEHYSHFTSPIRRYSDLVLHRLLFHEPSSTALEQIARKCSDQERVAAKAEMNVIGLKKLRWLANHDRTHPDLKYAAAVTKVKPFGIYFDVAPLSIEGFIHVSELSDDYYEYHPKVKCLIGQHTHQSFKVGDAIAVILAKIDLIIVEARWTLVTKKKPRKRKKN
ncbi:MAG: ribonuclease R family protein [Chlamydiota bacterium]